MIRRPPRSTQSRSSAASDVYKRQVGKPDVHDNDVGCVVADASHTLARGPCLTDHGEIVIRIDERSQTAPHHLVIVDEHDSERTRWLLSTWHDGNLPQSGSRGRTEWPRSEPSSLPS